MCSVSVKPSHDSIFTMYLQVDKENPVGLETLRTSDQSMMFMNDIRSKSREVERAEKRTAYGLKESPNPLLNLSVDLYR